MHISVLTLFPDLITEAVHTSILGRAAEAGLISVDAVNIRDFAFNKHHKVDDYPYGGGAGMVMQAEPVYLAYEAVTKDLQRKPRVIYTTPQGKVFDQKMAAEFAAEEELVILCGHYEGVDERVLTEIVTDHVSIGDYVLTGGELPALIMIDAVSRLIPGVLHNDLSAETESFENNLLEYPQYSRPEVWHDMRVPDVLLSGHHENVEKWRFEQSVERTLSRRPDLFERFLSQK
ncbi:MAG: tRNA (guanosine(37)-N1)-methyltransferase TrmD [Lachnospiraceae bacterium]|nr:tRNA (guanosine(37)-N1)-methyltransferase TrmD [Lachnospiraceae bacterium]